MHCGIQGLIIKIFQEIKEIAKRGTPIDIEKELPAIVECCIGSQIITSEICSVSGYTISQKF